MVLPEKQTNRQTGRQAGRTDGQMDRRTDGRTGQDRIRHDRTGPKGPYITLYNFVKVSTLQVQKSKFVLLV